MICAIYLDLVNIQVKQDTMIFVRNVRIKKKYNHSSYSLLTLYEATFSAVGVKSLKGYVKSVSKIA